MLHLVKMWLEAPVEETDERGTQRRSTRNRDEGRGTPQGVPISTLLSSLYMRRFVLGWKKLGYEERWKAYIVNYADDLVICCRTGAEPALATMQKMMSQLKLTVNDSMTRVCALPEEKFDFLGYTFGQCYSPKTGPAYLGTIPARAGAAHLRGNARTDRAEYHLAGSSDGRDEAQRHDVRMGELLLFWTGQYGLSCGG